MRFRFDDFTLDLETRQLRRGADALHLSRKAFDLLALLVADRPGVVGKDALRDRLWPGTTVVEANLNNLASEIRAALQDDAQHPRFLRTVHRVGYAFCGDAEEAGAPGASARCWLIWQDRVLPLTVAEARLGRDASCDVRIEAAGVSRRHATIRLDAGGAATIEDLGSTNGTFVKGRRIARATAIGDGDAIRVGDASLTFRTAVSADAPTKRIGRAMKRRERGV